MKNLAGIKRLAFMIMPRTRQELARVRRLAADERVMRQLCHIARCDEVEVKRQVERTGQSIHILRAYWLANGEWPK